MNVEMNETGTRLQEVEQLVKTYPRIVDMTHEQRLELLDLQRERCDLIHKLMDESP